MPSTCPTLYLLPQLMLERLQALQQQAQQVCLSTISPSPPVSCSSMCFCASCGLQMSTTQIFTLSWRLLQHRSSPERGSLERAKHSQSRKGLTGILLRTLFTTRYAPKCCELAVEWAIHILYVVCTIYPGCPDNMDISIPVRYVY